MLQPLTLWRLGSGCCRCLQAGLVVLAHLSIFSSLAPTLLLPLDGSHRSSPELREARR